MSERLLPVRLESEVPRAFGVSRGPRPPTRKAFLRLSLLTCPVALYPAAFDSEKISFDQINKKTGHRIKFLKVDALA